MADEFRDAGNATERVPQRGDGIDPTLVARLARAFHRQGAEIVHTHNPLPLIYGAPAARLVGARAIHTKHGLNPPARPSALVAGAAAAQLVHAFCRGLGDDRRTSTRAARHAARPTPYDRERNPARSISPRCRGARGDSRRARTRRCVGRSGTVGRLDDHKNQAAARARDARSACKLSSRVRLVIVGAWSVARRRRGRGSARAVPEPRWVVMTGRRMDVPRLVPRVRRVRAAVEDRGLAALVVPEEAMSAGFWLDRRDGRRRVADRDRR